MKKWMLLVLLVGCGPSWGDVIRHRDGTLQDPKTGKCWEETSYGPVPVKCPRNPRRTRLYMP